MLTYICKGGFGSGSGCYLAVGCGVTISKSVTKKFFPHF